MTQSNDVYLRLKKLYASLNIDTTEGSENDAEIYAYSRVIMNIKDKIKLALDNLFCVGSENLNMYIDLLNIDVKNKSYTELVNEIRAKLSMNFGEFKREFYDKELVETGIKDYRLENSKIIFSNIDRANLIKAHKFTDDYRAYFNEYYYESTNHLNNFDKIDSYKENWAYIDGLKLCWNFLELYREEI